jgi:hypothetical protein
VADRLDKQQRFRAERRSSKRRVGGWDWGREGQREDGGGAVLLPTSFSSFPYFPHPFLFILFLLFDHFRTGSSEFSLAGESDRARAQRKSSRAAST